jgi:hypothetical protein
MRHPVQIDQQHNDAIRAEMGERLRIILMSGNPYEFPARIQHLLNRLTEMEMEISPSIVPLENEGSQTETFSKPTSLKSAPRQR